MHSKKIGKKINTDLVNMYRQDLVNVLSLGDKMGGLGYGSERVDL